MTDLSNITLTPEGIKRSQQSFKDSLGNAPGGRYYAIGEGDLAPIAFWLTYCENLDTAPSTLAVGKFLRERIAPFAPDLFQQQIAEPKLPALPTVAGVEAANPFLHGDKESQNLWITRDPETAAFWKEAAEKGNGKPTFKQLLEYEKKLTEFRAVAAIDYGATQHRENPFLSNNRSAQNELFKTDAQRFAVFKWEAEHSPIKFTWSADENGSQFEINRALNRDEEVGQLFLRAKDIHRDLLQRQRTEAEKAIAAAHALLQRTDAATTPAKPFAGSLR
jgi:hypothetical protein